MIDLQPLAAILVPLLVVDAVLWSAVVSDRAAVTARDVVASCRLRGHRMSGIALRGRRAAPTRLYVQQEVVR